MTPSSKELNLLNADEVSDYLSKKKPEMIIHCAGLVGGIQANINDPTKFLLNNFYMGANLFKIAAEYSIPKAINLGSSCMYPKHGINPLKEELILNGKLETTNEGYALAKITIAKLCEYISTQNTELSYKTLIPCNLFGKYDNFLPDKSHMVPAIIKKIHEAKLNGTSTVEVWGDGTAKREYMYAEDFADCIWTCVQKFKSLPQYMNIGVGTDMTIRQYYETVSEIIGYRGNFKFDPSKPAGMKQKLVDISALKKIGWEKKFAITDGLAATYDHFLKSLNCVE